MTRERPLLSVVICTRKRARHAVECVQALLSAPDSADIEIIVVDNTSSQLHSEWLKQRLTALRVCSVREAKPGLSYARNLGLGLARAPWVAYLDDDVLPFPDWTARALELAKGSSERVGMIGGAVLPRWPAPGAPQAVAPSHLGRRWRELLSLVDGEQRPSNLVVPHVVGSNLLVRRALLQELGGFSSELEHTSDPHGAGELTIAREIAGRGLLVAFDSGLRVHHAISTERLEPAWARKRAEAAGELQWKRSPSSMTRVLLSIPFLALASTLRRLPTGAPRDYDRHVQLWQHLGFLKSAVSSVRGRVPALSIHRRKRLAQLT